MRPPTFASPEGRSHRSDIRIGRVLIERIGRVLIEAAASIVANIDANCCLAHTAAARAHRQTTLLAPPTKLYAKTALV